MRARALIVAVLFALAAGLALGSDATINSWKPTPVGAISKTTRAVLADGDWDALHLDTTARLITSGGETGTDVSTTLYRSQLSVVDAVAVATLTSSTTGEYAPKGPNVNVSARFTASGATVGIRLVRLYKPASTYYLRGESPIITLTAGTGRDLVTSYYVAPDYLFWAGSAPIVRIEVATACSSGNVDLWLESY